MITEKIVSHGVALDTARITGHTVFIMERVREHNGGVTVEDGLVVGEGQLKLMDVKHVRARYTAAEAVAFIIKLGITVAQRDCACVGAQLDAKKFMHPQTVWQLANGEYFSCHSDIVIRDAERLFHVS